MFEPVIGLEIHAILKTNTKMFCGCLNDLNEKRPNVNICPVCTGHPGVLPTINKQAVESVIRVGLALGGNIPEISKFDRKNYFYPDLPKGYQISQYDKPLVEGGSLKIKNEDLNIDKEIKITRIHLEEDAARMAHQDKKNKDGKIIKSSLVDFNRSGSPLMELVTEPDLSSAAETRLFAEELRTILRYIGASDGDMEKGEMRIEANVSVKERGASELPNYKVELKNINSFKAVESAVSYEINRQTKTLKSGKRLKHETRGWRDDKGITESQRSKEEAHDYRYFPEPDLPIIETSKLNIDVIKNSLTELPRQKLERFESEFGLSFSHSYLLTRNSSEADFFENAVSELKGAIDDPEKKGPASDDVFSSSLSLLYNYFTSDLRGLMKENNASILDLRITPAQLSDLISMIVKKEISSRIAKDLLLEMYSTGGDPHEIIKDKEMQQVSDNSSIEDAVTKVLDDNEKAVSDYKKGKESAIQYLFGQTMRELKGRGDPNKIKSILERKLRLL